MATMIAAHGHTVEDQAVHDRKMRFGMIFYILTDVVLAIFLTAAYPFLRTLNNVQGWFPYHFQLDFSSGNMITIALIVSAVLYFIGYRALKAGSQGLFRGAIVLAALLMIGSFIAQIMQMGKFPFAASDGSFASTFVVLSGYHAYHLAFGTIFGLGVGIRALRGRYSSGNTLGVQLIGYYWYWAVLYSIVLTLLPILLPPALS
ncbi:MAG TPA: cytochrome c oxidase subunit 3 [Ktedonobacterales bacterium]